MLDCKEQYCKECGDPTGRAGNFHDSLYVMVGDRKVGPLCDECARIISESHDTEIIYE